MMQPPKGDPSRTHEAHIYMTEKEYTSLKRRAKAECRSINGQVMFYIQRGLNQDAAEEIP